jgi:hypothetical protein
LSSVNAEGKETHLSVAVTRYDLPKKGILTNQQKATITNVLYKGMLYGGMWGNNATQISHLRHMRVVTKFGICGGEESLVKVV